MSRILGKPVHQAYVFPDFDEAIGRFAALGIGPFFVLHSEGGSSRYRGVDHPLSLSVAFVYSGDTCFEIIAPHGDQQSAYGEYIRRNPDGGLHHICYYADDFEKTLASLAAGGQKFEIVQEFADPRSGEPFEIYCEPVGIDNPVLFQLIRPGLFDRWFDAMRQAASNWDGSDPIRDARPYMAEAMA